MTQPEINTALEHQLVQIARSFAVQMNEIEGRIFTLQQNDKEGKIDHFAVYREAYDPVFQQFTTDKRRVYGGQATSFGWPPKYDGITQETTGKAEIKSKSKAEVYFQTNNRCSAEYLFVLHRKADEWRIDNVKYKWFYNGKWSSLIM
ncbi:NTF2 fold immunity protein [Chitinophaga solisilvae]|uniref:NTF2 fold immunity protein n=1 Tax=Chitinophaga solisilvae TaxID=1233460 RepID=UPI001370CB6A|nr:NTF2 fold immunity protein [Chitinophaga solisilvae]